MTELGAQGPQAGGAEGIGHRGDGAGAPSEGGRTTARGAAAPQPSAAALCCRDQTAGDGKGAGSPETIGAAADPSAALFSAGRKRRGAGASDLDRPKIDCGDFEMRIARDGTWYYRGSPIGRKELVCLFASVLRREEDGGYLLETPVERGRITVDDVPFIATELFWRHCEGRQCLTFRTNLDEMVTADAEHPIRVALCPITREPRPYVTVRPGLEARINRSVFYELVALGETEDVDGQPMIGVWSQGVFFPIDEAPQCDAFDDEDDDDDEAEDDAEGSAPRLAANPALRLGKAAE